MYLQCKGILIIIINHIKPRRNFHNGNIILLYWQLVGDDLEHMFTVSSTQDKDPLLLCIYYWLNLNDD